MPDSLVTAPKGPTYAKVSDYTTYLDEDGNLLPYYQDCVPMRANEAITRWAAVALVEATTTVPMSVELLDVSDAYASTMFLGVAQEAAAAGEIVNVCKGGFTLAKIDTTDPIRGSVAAKGAADGQLAAVLIGALDATIVDSSIFGVFIDVENASDLAPLWLYGR